MIQVEHVPLLQVARNLHDIPRGMARFQEYLRLIVGEATDDIEIVPLVGMNPMGREHVAARLDEWLALSGDEAAAEMLHEAAGELAHLTARFRHGLVVADDVMGGWTNRYTSDMGARFYAPSALKRGWLTTILWVSEPATLTHLRQAVRATLYRALSIQRHGPAQSLRQMMSQEGNVAHFAGATLRLDAEDIAYSREVLQPYRSSTHHGECMAALYGDTAAHEVGYTPLGLSPFAGLEVALADAPDRATSLLTPQRAPTTEEQAGS